jgi:hypothetical protein
MTKLVPVDTRSVPKSRLHAFIAKRLAKSATMFALVLGVFFLLTTTRCVRIGFANNCIDAPRKERKKGFKRGPYNKGRRNSDGTYEEWTGMLLVTLTIQSEGDDSFQAQQYLDPNQQLVQSAGMIGAPLEAFQYGEQQETTFFPQFVAPPGYEEVQAPNEGYFFPSQVLDKEEESVNVKKKVKKVVREESVIVDDEGEMQPENFGDTFALFAQ